MRERLRRGGGGPSVAPHTIWYAECGATVQCGVATPVPRLVGRDQAEVVKAMQEFRSGTRAATVMDRIARGFTDQEILAIAAWYASQR